ncbi:hypothetical protein E4T38_07988 [Aureobasidium subglaciale]|nr:hypothetical protein E4T38_07988 [Aureobasidium subglaciale]KAI5216305.1 hypothetical protein E4T40_07998 [Aureobasidium subglaciale]KAI5219560.1 hypothetical protein E4T41_07913 [Aureobasidium subglaciale]KAI5257623.1 hypothetical protein E4T46_07889 [Aureobasidium subglaciale]
MTTTDRYHSLIRLKSARSIPTNFGFIFQAGSIQLSESSSTSNNLSFTATLIEADSHPEHQPSLANVAAKRKRVVKEDEEDGEIWFKKRSKKTSTKQEHNEETVDTATSNVAPDEPRPEAQTKPTKRKVVRKRILVPKPRQKPSTKPQLDAQHDQPMSTSEAMQEAPTEVEKKIRKPATVKVAKRQTKEAETPVVTIPEKGQEDELSNHSLHAISASRPAASKATKSSQDVQHTVVEPRSRKKAAPVRRVVRKQKPDITMTTRQVVSEDSQTTASIAPMEEKGPSKTPKATDTKKLKEVNSRAENQLERVQETEHIDAVTPTEGQSSPTPATREVTTETAQSPKKRKLVRRVRVPKVLAASATLKTTPPADLTPRKDGTKPLRSKGRSPLKERDMNSTPEDGEPKDDSRSSENRSKNSQKIGGALPGDTSLRKTSAVAEDVDLSLFEAAPSAQIIKKKTKTTKAPKRVFNDDSDIDLDQMLSGIAAMADPKGVTKVTASNPSRVVKRKAAA